MSRYIDADAIIKIIEPMCGAFIEGDFYIDYQAVLRIIDDAPSYVPKDFHDKTCEAMSKRHQEEISDMVSVVRCKECKYHFYDESNDCKMCYIHEYGEIWEDDDYCSYGEREGE